MRDSESERVREREKRSPQWFFTIREEESTQLEWNNEPKPPTGAASVQTMCRASTQHLLKLLVGEHQYSKTHLDPNTITHLKKKEKKEPLTGRGGRLREQETRLAVG